MDIYSVQLSQLTHMKKYSSDYSNLDEDYIFSHINIEVAHHLHEESRPMRINGLTMLLCLEGGFGIDVNLDHYEITSNSVLVIGPDSIIKFDSIEDEKIDAYMMFVSPDFMKDINLDINAVNLAHMPKYHTPVTTLTDEESGILRKYLEMFHFNASTNSTPVYKRNIARCLMASMIYQMMQFSEHREALVQDEEPVVMSRRHNYVRDFMVLVQKYHCRERSVAFYAGKLFISAKYLSLIIKESTGKSAADWIDEYVILEAKNLLRYSGKNIQQVAYDLNFTNQSSFGKYFKHLTGMSPSEFQRS